MHAVTAWMVHPLTGILVGTKMNKQQINLNKNKKQQRQIKTYKDFSEEIKRKDPNISRRQFRVEEAKFVLRRIEENKRKGRPHPNDRRDYKTYSAILEKLTGERPPPLRESRSPSNQRQQADSVEDIESMLRSKFHLVLIDESNDVIEPVDKKYWPALEADLWDLAKVRAKKPGSTRPKFKAGPVIQGFLLIKCKYKSTKMFLMTTFNRLRFKIPGKRLALIPAPQLPSILQNISVVEKDQSINRGLQLEENYFESNIDDDNNIPDKRQERLDRKYKQNQKHQRYQMRKDNLQYEGKFDIKRSDNFAQDFESDHSSVFSGRTNSEFDLTGLGSFNGRNRSQLSPRREYSPALNEFPSISQRHQESRRTLDHFTDNRDFDERESFLHPAEEEHPFTERHNYQPDLRERLNAGNMFNEARRKLQRIETESREHFPGKRMRRNSIEETFEPRRRFDNFDDFQHQNMTLKRERERDLEMPDVKNFKTEHFERFDELPSTSVNMSPFQNRGPNEWSANGGTRDNWFPTNSGGRGGGAGGLSIDRMPELSQGSTSQSHSDLQIVIVDRNQNEGRISLDVWQKMEKLLLEYLAREMQQTNNPQISRFDGHRFQNGFKIITCENIESYRFIKRFLYEQINCAPNANYDAIPVKDLPGRAMAKLWMKPPNIDDLAAVNILQAQNPMFLSEDWILIKSRERSNGSGKDLFFSVSLEAAGRLRLKRGEIRYGTFQLKMIILD